MDIGNEMHQQFIKDFIQSLQAGSEDSNSNSNSNSCMQSNSRSLSDSSLNPNAAEFVPSYMKSSDADDDEEPHQYQRQEQKPSASSSTTLVENTLNRIQRQLYNLMNQLGNQNLPLTQIRFTLAPNGQGINVQFMALDSGKRQSLNKHLCNSAAFRLEIGDVAEHNNRPGHSLAAQFLSRMGNVLNDKSEGKLPSICPKCTALPKKRSFTELEIDRQIEDIKAFEKLINEDAGARYQDAFKQLCQKLGLSTNGGQALDFESTETVPLAINEINNDDSEVPFNEDELSTLEWDPYMPELTTMKVYGYSAPSATDVHVNDQGDHQKVHQEQLSLKEDYEMDAQTPAMSTTTAPVSTVYPKLYKVNQVKWTSSPGPGPRKTGTHKEKESKIQRWRYSSPAAATTPASAATPSVSATSTTVAAPAAATNAAATVTSAGSATGSASKKLPERGHLNGNRIKRAYQCTMQPKTGNAGNMSEVTASQIAKPSSNYKQEPRSQIGMPKQQLDHVHVNKLNKAATLSRTAGIGSTQGTKHSPAGGAQRIVAPRSTHASQMRQSEVKRRLNLMRGDNDTDVQFNEYLFK
ncbi:uncharacterized protein LOC115760210 [Drosophila novamexicana]|uniref:uncharacterized protein LOC115760210 n=1 Tax=Drosophila novamexicana TaxID=47314 RepID=UPI0011E5B471|nr:uncharacterized protein LOC115760210 [Drosophila novamexicana]